MDNAQARMHNYNLSRFTSPDPYKIVAEIQNIVDEQKARAKLNSYIILPQQWNRYSYVVNNPLKYIDPTGEIIRLTGSREQVNSEAYRLGYILGEERIKNIKVKQNCNKSGSKCTVDISLSKEDAKKIENIGDDKENRFFSKGMAALLSTNKVIEFNVAKKVQYNDVDGKTKTEVLGSSENGGGKTFNGKIIRVFSAESSKLAKLGFKDSGDISEDGKPITINIQMIDAHELGHAYGYLLNMSSSKNDEAAVKFENAIRTRYRNPRKRSKH